MLIVLSTQLDEIQFRKGFNKDKCISFICPFLSSSLSVSSSISFFLPLLLSNIDIFAWVFTYTIKLTFSHFGRMVLINFSTFNTCLVFLLIAFEWNNLFMKSFSHTKLCVIFRKYNHLSFSAEIVFKYGCNLRPNNILTSHLELGLYKM